MVRGLPQQLAGYGIDATPDAFGRIGGAPERSEGNVVAVRICGVDPLAIDCGTPLQTAGCSTGTGLCHPTDDSADRTPRQGGTYPCRGALRVRAGGAVGWVWDSRSPTDQP